MTDDTKKNPNPNVPGAKQDTTKPLSDAAASNDQFGAAAGQRPMNAENDPPATHKPGDVTNANRTDTDPVKRNPDAVARTNR